jgi:hypothetical protein
MSTIDLVSDSSDSEAEMADVPSHGELLKDESLESDEQEAETSFAEEVAQAVERARRLAVHEFETHLVQNIVSKSHRVVMKEAKETLDKCSKYIVASGKSNGMRKKKHNRTLQSLRSMICVQNVKRLVCNTHTRPYKALLGLRKTMQTRVIKMMGDLKEAQMKSSRPLNLLLDEHLTDINKNYAFGLFTLIHRDMTSIVSEELKRLALACEVLYDVATEFASLYTWT